MDEFLDKEVNSDSNRYLSFDLSNEIYVISVSDVKEIIGVQEFTPIPRIEDHVKGLMNLRGKIVPVLDLRLYFNIPAKEYSEKTCVLVLGSVKGNVGVIVDSVREVLDIPINKIQKDINSKKENDCVLGMANVHDEIQIVLDVEFLLERD